MSIVAYCHGDEVLVMVSEDETDFIARTKRDLRTYERIALAPGEVFHTKIFQPRIIVHKLISD